MSVELTPEERRAIWGARANGGLDIAVARIIAARVEAERARITANVEALNGADLIAAERRRQVEVEGYSADHDREHGVTRLSTAAAAYEFSNPDLWPFESSSYKPKDRLSDLIRAGALRQAVRDIDRAHSDLAVRRCAAKIDAILHHPAIRAALADEGDDALRKLQAKAWDEGYDVGCCDADASIAAIEPPFPEPTPNPYERNEADDG